MFSRHLMIKLKRSITILQTLANLNVAREIPSIDTDPLSYVNPVWTEYFLSNGSMFKKS